MKLKNGFSLVEIMIASLILTIAVAGILTVFTFAKRSTNLPGSQFQAMNLVREKAEELRVAVDHYYYTYNINNLSTGTHGPESIIPPAGPINNAQRTYLVSEVDLDNDGITESRQVTIILNWNEPTAP